MRLNIWGICLNLGEMHQVRPPITQLSAFKHFPECSKVRKPSQAQWFHWNGEADIGVQGYWRGWRQQGRVQSRESSKEKFSQSALKGTLKTLVKCHDACDLGEDLWNLAVNSYLGAVRWQKEGDSGVQTRQSRESLLHNLGCKGHSQGVRLL